MLPSDPAFDSTLALLSEGYTFISSRCDRLQSDGFTARIMLRRAVCLRGAEAAKLLYSPELFTRVNAMPRTVLHLLQDKGSVNLLDDAAHRHRKRLFLEAFDEAGADRLVAALAAEWREALPRWREEGRLVLHHALYEVLTGAALAWAGIAADAQTRARRAREFRAMIENTGSFGPANWGAQLLRLRTESWAANLIEETRGKSPPDNSPLSLAAWHRDPDGRLLEPKIAAVELINILRPIAATARFVTFAALALHRHPYWRDGFAAGSDEGLEDFVQEVRRFYPFFPFIGGRARRPWHWNGVALEEGAWALFDLYGTNHDARLWPEPESFRPERFANWPGDPWSFVAQGAGDRETGHRCPGERTVIELVKEAVRLLTRAMRYDVPAQDLTVNLAHIPALPRSGFVIAGVRPV